MNKFFNANLYLAIAMICVNIFAFFSLHYTYGIIKDLREETTLLLMIKTKLEKGCK